MCSQEAFIDRKTYELPPIPKSKDKAQQDMLFREWQADAISKYPYLLNSYDVLRKCWDAYK